MSKSATDIGRTNLIKLDTPTKSPCISCQPYSIPLKYRDFVDEEIQELEDAGIISMLKQKNLYTEPRDKNKPTAKGIEDGTENVIVEVHHLTSTQGLTQKEIDIPMLRSHQKEDQFCKERVKKVTSGSMKTEFDIDQNGILCRSVRLWHGWKLVSVIPRSLVAKIIYKYHECRGHPGVTKIVNMIQRYFWFQGLRSSVYSHIRTCKLCIQFLPNRIRTRQLHLEIPKIPFYTICLDTIGKLPTMSKGNCYTLICMDLLMSYLITVLMKSKSVDEVTMAYLKRVLPISSCSMYILQDNGTEFRNKQLVDTFKSLRVKPIYSSPYYPCGNGKLKNSHNFLKWSIAKFYIIPIWSGMM